MEKIKVLGLCGSLRADSWNLKLLRNFLAALDGGPFTTELYGALDLPLMNEDLEKSPLDARVLALRAAVERAHVVAFASPEYNGSLSPALKNAIDWGTRTPGNVWQGKAAVLLAASPGVYGGVRGLIHLRTVLSGIKMWVIPEQVQCPQAPQAFDGAGVLTSEIVQKQVRGAMQGLETFTKKILP
jgi:NAD(P)H-dependent FMN reductase